MPIEFQISTSTQETQTELVVARKALTDPPQHYCDSIGGDLSDVLHLMSDKPLRVSERQRKPMQ